MNFTRFTLIQDGHAIGEFTVMELAVSAARQPVYGFHCRAAYASC